MKNADRLEKIEEASEMLEEVIRLVKEAVRGSSEQSRAEAYVIPSLKMCLNDQHGYLGGQPCNLQELGESFSEDEEDDASSVE